MYHKLSSRLTKKTRTGTLYKMISYINDSVMNDTWSCHSFGMEWSWKLVGITKTIQGLEFLRCCSGTSLGSVKEKWDQEERPMGRNVWKLKERSIIKPLVLWHHFVNVHTNYMILASQESHNMTSQVLVADGIGLHDITKAQFRAQF